MAIISEVKSGLVLKINNDLGLVVDMTFVAPGKGSAFYKVKVKSLSSGKVIEHTIKSGESVEIAEVERENMQYLYPENDKYAFMNMETFEQMSISKDLIGDDARFLKEGLEVMFTTYEGRAVGILLPKKITYKVVEAPPAVKGNTAGGNVTKEVVLENGLKAQTPIFIVEGESIVINTETGFYVERAQK